MQVDSFVDRSERIARQQKLAALRTKLEAEREALKKEQPRGAPTNALKARKNKNTADLKAVKSGQFPEERQTQLEAARIPDEEVAASALRNAASYATNKVELRGSPKRAANPEEDPYDEILADEDVHSDVLINDENPSAQDTPDSADDDKCRYPIPPNWKRYFVEHLKKLKACGDVVPASLLNCKAPDPLENHTFNSDDWGLPDIDGFAPYHDKGLRKQGV